MPARRVHPIQNPAVGGGTGRTGRARRPVRNPVGQARGGFGQGPRMEDGCDRQVGGRAGQSVQAAGCRARLGVGSFRGRPAREGAGRCHVADRVPAGRHSDRGRVDPPAGHRDRQPAGHALGRGPETGGHTAAPAGDRRRVHRAGVGQRLRHTGQPGYRGRDDAQPVARRRCRPGAHRWAGE